MSFNNENVSENILLNLNSIGDSKKTTKNFDENSKKLTEIGKNILDLIENKDKILVNELFDYLDKNEVIKIN